MDTYVRFDKRSFTQQSARAWLESNCSEFAPHSETESSHVFKCTSPDTSSLSTDGVTIVERGNVSGVVYKAGTQSADDPHEYILSDESVDRVGDIIRVKGWQLGEFKKNPIALFGHSHRDIIGVWKNVRVSGGKLMGRLHLAAEGTSEIVDVTRKLVEQRILKAVSVGFMPLEAQPREKDDPWGGYEFTKSALHEASLVAVPANPHALQLAKALSPAAERFFVQSDNLLTGATAKDVLGRAANQLKTPNLEQARCLMRDLGIKN